MSELIQIRKTVTHVETIRHEGGPPLEEPLKKGAIMIVLRNPYAGSFVEDVMPMMEALKPYQYQLQIMVLKLPLLMT